MTCPEQKQCFSLKKTGRQKTAIMNVYGETGSTQARSGSGYLWNGLSRVDRDNWICYDFSKVSEKHSQSVPGNDQRRKRILAVNELKCGPVCALITDNCGSMSTVYYVFIIVCARWRSCMTDDQSHTLVDPNCRIFFQISRRQLQYSMWLVFKYWAQSNLQAMG